jgi:hypothetical protein
LHFSELKWIRYEFPKHWLISGISNSPRKRFVPTQTLARVTDGWVSDHVTCHEGMAESNNLTQSKDDVTDEIHSQIMFKFVDSLQIRTCGGVESNRGIKAVHVVVATSIFGHRSLLRRTLLRRAATVYVGLRNQSAREMTEGLGSLRISPGTRWSARWGRGRSKTDGFIA